MYFFNVLYDNNFELLFFFDGNYFPSNIALEYTEHWVSINSVWKNGQIANLEVFDSENIEIGINYSMLKFIILL